MQTILVVREVDTLIEVFQTQDLEARPYASLGQACLQALPDGIIIIAAADRKFAILSRDKEMIGVWDDRTLILETPMPQERGRALSRRVWQHVEEIEKQEGQ